MRSLSWDELDSDLEQRLVSQRARLRELREWWAPDAIPQHVLAGSVLAESIISAVKSQSSDDLYASLQVLEEMAASSDPRLTEAAGVSVLERIRGEPEAIAAVADMLGPKSRRLLDEQLRWHQGRS